ncbi:histone acetyltransferases subunit 3-domain-containing protein [Amylostereum chailletii]|nr:histone acetyltransferases subunit 3-domain-containing protein [Amylostereum chailletii]
MSPVLASYEHPTPYRTTLPKSFAESVPPTDELEKLQAELNELRQRSLARAKKAGDDLRTIEESMRRLKEKEKGKARASDKVKREHGFAPPPNEAEPTRSSFAHGASNSRPPPLPLASNSSSRSSLDPRKSNSVDTKKKKKKRKREEEEEEDEESEPLRNAKPTPPPHQLPSYPPHIPKAAKPTGSFANLPTKLPSGPDFNFEPPSPLLPSRPLPLPPPIPGPSKITDVTEDFSKAKQPSQTPITTFYTSIEPYLRAIKEEYVGFLEHTGDEIEPYIMPRLGRHYSEQWEDEDINTYGTVPPSTATIRANSSYGRPAVAAPHPKWDPATLSEADLVTEDRGHGPLTERLISALLPMEDVNWKGVKAAEGAMAGKHGVGVGNAAGRQVIVEDLEKRLRDNLKYHKLLDSTPDYSDPVDDPIASALRQAQRELRTVVSTNKARKVRLASIAKDRLGYQEYLDLRDSLDKNISTLYTKLQKKDGPKASKKKKQKVAAVSAEPNGTAATPLGTWPASSGLGPDEDNFLRVPEQLQQLVATRRQWVDAVGAVFDEKEREQPGRIWAIPPSSIYGDIDEEGEESISRRDDEPRGVNGLGYASKGKGRVTDDMDIG